jgi:NADH dehydrogenase
MAADTLNRAIDPTPAATPAVHGRADNTHPDRLKVVILGGGFAGIAAARALKRAPVDVIVIDKTNHHLFQPLLYQVATAQLAPSDIAAPIRHILRKQKNTEVILGEVRSIDPERKVVFVGDEPREYPYDYLIITTGSRHSYFGKTQWERDAPGLKSLSDALNIRERFLMAFEEAERSEDPAERAALMTFVIVGGGPTGCEMAGVLPEIARRAMRPEFRRIDTADTRVILIEAGPRILPTFPDDLAARAKRDLEGLGVEVRAGARVVNIEPDAVYLDGGERLRTHTVIWAAGNQSSPVVQGLGAPLDRAGRVLVEPDLSVPGRPEIFVAGDLAATKNPDGSPVPGVAQAAMQGGARAGKNVLRRLYREKTEPFHYFDKGNLAVIGRNKAIADLHFVHIGGFVAWLVWLFIHILYLVGFRNRLSVLLQWAYAYLTYQRGARLITDRDIRRHQAREKAEGMAPGPRDGAASPDITTARPPAQPPSPVGSGATR